ncbi:hypothetical protein [Rhodococcus sp. IEGM 1343]|uniref:hypothetical protein n=1 Tax=Rhodococcus sp. IEGM 1343 TaxID=3082224 RepID=UPI0029551D2F|nr:hypothetical protein [Rhodococcus sp. IEGM 1343]MDV8056475.1 hypothetical protein [Rhodococcus sp. IEGM 1343]
MGLDNLSQPALHDCDSFGILNNVMVFLDEMLRVASDADQSQWFPNNVAAIACLGRAYQGVQSCVILCVTGLYLDAKASIRLVYEAGGLATALAKSTQDAEQWLHENHWKSDAFTRKIRKELSGGDKGARRNYEQFYKQASAYAHPAATSVMPVIFGRDTDERFGVRLYPEFDEQQFRSVAREIVAVALHVAYSAVEATAAIETIPADWLAHLDETQAKFDKSIPAIERDWNEHERRHKILTGRVRHDDELDQALTEDETSTRNLKKAFTADESRRQ